jgi:hypothetical protein
MPAMQKTLIAVALAACLAFFAVACGGGDSSDTTNSIADTPEPKATQGVETTKSKPESKSQKDRQGSGSSQGGSEPSGSKSEAAEFKAPPGGDDSIQTYGSTLEGDEKEAIVTAMRSFFRALAATDYPTICAGLTNANREQLKLFLKQLKKQQGGCEDVLAKLQISRAAPEAQKAARGAIYQVRVEDDTAFVLFTPAGGSASYFVMQKEDGDWKSTSLASGVPFDPLAASGQ